MTKALVTLRTSLQLGAAVLAVALIGPRARARSRRDALRGFHAALPQRYPDVHHMTADELAALGDENVALFDVRPFAEFDVGHLSGAIQIDPDIETCEFLTRYGSMIGERTPVFYCSVGERSSKLAQTLVETGRLTGPAYNLERGVFGWHNEARELVDPSGPTECVHPFNRFWGRMLTRREHICRKAKG